MAKKYIDLTGLSYAFTKIKTLVDSRVPNTRKVNGKALSADVTLAAGDVGAVPTTRKVNGKALSADVTLAAGDVGAVPTTRTINSKALSANITLSASDVSAVPTTRKVNGKALSADVSLAAADVGAVPTTRTINDKALSEDLTLTASDVGAAASSHNHAASAITSGTLGVARGGTGVTSNPSMLVNLASTSADTVFEASPRPGVTGTLPVANGGTGSTTAAAARTALGITPANIGAAASGHSHDAATQSAAGFLSAADKTKLDGIANGANAYTLPAATSSQLGGVKIGSNISVSSGTISVPAASGTQAGVTVVYPADKCTTFSSDSGTVTPLAVQKGAKQFAITRPASSTNKAITRYSNTTGDVQDSKIIVEDVTNSRDTSKTAQVIAIPAEGGKKMVYGYCTDQVDGTSFIGGVFDADATAYPYAQGLAIGGTSGNLLWKGNRVLDNTDLTTINSSISAKAALASPTFTGTPKAPTASAGTNTTQIATTAFVQTAVSGKAATGHGHDAATTSAAGFMSAADKTKLNGIAAGATNTPAAFLVTLTGTMSNGFTSDKTLSDIRTAYNAGQRVHAKDSEGRVYNLIFVSSLFAQLTSTKASEIASVIIAYDGTVDAVVKAIPEITAGTTDLTAGTSTGTPNSFYFVYET